MLFMPDISELRNVGQRKDVARPTGLGKLFRSEKSIGGFTILGSGEVALIVDVPGLMGQIGHERAAGEIVSFPRSGTA